MCRQPSMPIAPPITVPSVQNAMVRTPFTVPAAGVCAQESKPGVLEAVQVVKHDNVSVIRINASEPIADRLNRRNDQIEVNLENVAAAPAAIRYDKAAFPEIRDMQVESGSSNASASSRITDGIVRQGLAKPTA